MGWWGGRDDEKKTPPRLPLLRKAWVGGARACSRVGAHGSPLPALPAACLPRPGPLPPASCPPGLLACWLAVPAPCSPSPQLPRHAHDTPPPPHTTTHHHHSRLPSQGHTHSEPPKNLFKGYDGKLTVGVLPSALFCSGHTYFVQVWAQRVPTRGSITRHIWCDSHLRHSMEMHVMSKPVGTSSCSGHTLHCAGELVEWVGRAGGAGVLQGVGGGLGRGRGGWGPGPWPWP